MDMAKEKEQADKEAQKLHTVKVKHHTYKKLTKYQGFIQMTEAKKYSMSDIIDAALEFVPDIEFDAEEREAEG